MLDILSAVMKRFLKAMDMSKIIIFINIFIVVVKCEEPPEIKIGLIRRSDQENILEWSRSTLELIKSDNKYEILDISINENENEGCSIISKERPLLILDVSWDEKTESCNSSHNLDIPYFKINIVNPLFEILQKYFTIRKIDDVCLIIEESEILEEFLAFRINTPGKRMYILELFNNETVNRLQNLNPHPSKIAVIGSVEYLQIFVEMAVKADLLKLPDRWILVPTELNGQKLNISLLNKKEISVLTLDTGECCQLKPLPHSCLCEEESDMRKPFLRLLLNNFIAAINAVVKEESDRFSNSTLNDVDLPRISRERFEEILNLTLSKDYISWTGTSLRMRYSGRIENTKNINSTIVIKIVDTEFLINDSEIMKPIKPFYRVGVTHALPWSFKVKDPKTGTWIWTGYCIDFTKKISEMMNFDFEFVEPKNGTVGTNKNGVWNGVIGDLVAGRTDIAITAITMTAEREEVVDFVAPYFEQTGITIVMRKPVRKTSLFKFMTVLKLEVWLSIVAALIATGCMVWLLDKYSPYSARNNKKAYPYPCRLFTLKESFWFALTSFTPQGGGEAPKALSSRTLVAAYWLFVVLMLATFTANLAAFLTVERMQAPVQSLEQLAKQSRINYTVVKDSDTHKYFINMKNAEDTLYRMWKELTLNATTDDDRYRVWDYPIREQYGHILLAINDSNPVSSAEEGFEKVNEHLDADYAFIHDSSEIKYRISHNCNLTEVGEIFAEKPYAVAVQQGSLLQDEISKIILMLQKDRFFDMLQGKYWNHSFKGYCPNVDDNEGITLESLGGVFIATLFGLALALITLMGEVLYYRKKQRVQSVMTKATNTTREIHQAPVKTLSVISTSFSNAKHRGTKLTKPQKIKNIQKDSEIINWNIYSKDKNRVTFIN